MKSCPTCHRRFVDDQDTCPLDDARLASAPGPLPPGLGRELGTYRLVGLLGEGGMGSIYIGKHLTLQRHVAIKVLRADLASRKENVARFFQEAHTINRLHHPHIVESIDLVEDVTEGAYCVLELLRGPDLKTRLAHAGALPPETVLHVGIQIADAIAAVHALGIVHRDLKPENLILMEKDGQPDFVKLIDFGIAQIGQQSTGIAVGTAAYMAPEQAAGRPVDGRADIYSLGVMLFQMITGRHPFPSRSDGEYLMRHADTLPPRPSKLTKNCPPALESAILRCLSKVPDDRYPTAQTLAMVLRAIDPSSRARRGAATWVAGLVLLGGAAAAATVYVPPLLHAQQPADAQTVAMNVTATPAAPAASPPPAVAVPAPADTAPVIVDIDVVSSPAGAKAYRLGETVPLGTTPFSVQLPRSDKPVQMRFELPGYEAKQIAVPIAASTEIDVTLAKAQVVSRTAPPPPPDKAPDKPKPKKVQREGVMDPFAPQ